MAAEPASKDLLQINTNHVDNFSVGPRFANLQPIGYGANGIVFTAADLQQDRNVAIKRICFHDNRSCRQALREIRIMKRLVHENVVTLHEVVGVNGQALDQKDGLNTKGLTSVYIIQELLDTDLHQLIQAQGLSPAHVQLFAYQMLRALKYIHSANVLHRDLKPSNIFVNLDTLLLKLGDFGLARVVDTNYSHMGFLTEKVGTCWYRAPELIISPKNYNKSIDIWSAGCILAEMITSKPLFSGAQELDQMCLILDSIALDENDRNSVLQVMPNKVLKNRAIPQRTSLRDRVAGADSKVMELLEKMVAFKPSQRISAEEALGHPYFHEYSCVADEPLAAHPFFIESEVDDLPADSLRQLICIECGTAGDMHIQHPSQEPADTATLPDSKDNSVPAHPVTPHLWVDQIREDTDQRRAHLDEGSWASRKHCWESAALETEDQKPEPPENGQTDFSATEELWLTVNVEIEDASMQSPNTVMYKLTECTDYDEKEMLELSPKKLEEDEEMERHGTSDTDMYDDVNNFKNKINNGEHQFSFIAEEVETQVWKNSEQEEDETWTFTLQMKDQADVMAESEEECKEICNHCIYSVDHDKDTHQKSESLPSDPSDCYSEKEDEPKPHFKQPPVILIEDSNKQTLFTDSSPDIGGADPLLNTASRTINIHSKCETDKLESEKSRRAIGTKKHATAPLHNLDELYRLPTEHLTHRRNNSNERRRLQKLQRQDHYKLHEEVNMKLKLESEKTKHSINSCPKGKHKDDRLSPYVCRQARVKSPSPRSLLQSPGSISQDAKLKCSGPQSSCSRGPAHKSVMCSPKGGASGTAVCKATKSEEKVSKSLTSPVGTKVVGKQSLRDHSRERMLGLPPKGNSSKESSVPPRSTRNSSKERGIGPQSKGGSLCQAAGGLQSKRSSSYERPPHPPCNKRGSKQQQPRSVDTTRDRTSGSTSGRSSTVASWTKTEVSREKYNADKMKTFSTGITSGSVRVTPGSSEMPPPVSKPGKGTPSNKAVTGRASRSIYKMTAASRARMPSGGKDTSCKVHASESSNRASTNQASARTSSRQPCNIASTKQAGTRISPGKANTKRSSIQVDISSSASQVTRKMSTDQADTLDSTSKKATQTFSNLGGISMSMSQTDTGISCSQAYTKTSCRVNDASTGASVSEADPHAPLPELEVKTPSCSEDIGTSLIQADQKVTNDQTKTAAAGIKSNSRVKKCASNRTPSPRKESVASRKQRAL